MITYTAAVYVVLDTIYIAGTVVYSVFLNLFIFFQNVHDWNC